MNAIYDLDRTWITDNMIISLTYKRAPNVINLTNIQYMPAKGDDYDKL